LRPPLGFELSLAWNTVAIHMHRRGRPSYGATVSAAASAALNTTQHTLGDCAGHATVDVIDFIVDLRRELTFELYCWSR
jgi:hypothetical protein